MHKWMTLLAALSAFFAPCAYSEPADVCVAVFEKAEQDQVVSSAGTSSLAVTGTGRLFFHTAPDRRCQLKDTYVIAGDRVEVFSEYGEFSSVIYWHPVSGAGTAGWVLSSRIMEPPLKIAVVRGQR